MDPTVDAVERAATRCQEQFPDDPVDEELVFGIDGIVDTVREVIDERRGTAAYQPVTQLTSIRDRIDASVELESSATFEWVATSTRTGGHVCHLSRALGGLGYRPRMIGTFGDPVQSIFQREFDDYPMVSIGDPGRTDAVEFNDGKLLLTESGDYRTLDWETLRDRIGVDRLAEHVDGAALLSLGYWTIIPSLPDVLQGIRRDLWPRLSSPPDRIFLDPGDVRNTAESDIETGVNAISALDDVVPTTVSANRSETAVFASHFADAGDDLERSVTVAREGLDVTRFVGHGVERAATATRSATTAVPVPRVADPELTTSAGDHFNAGLLVGLLASMDEDAALVVANALAGWFVRTGEAPNWTQLRSFVESYAQRFE